MMQQDIRNDKKGFILVILAGLLIVLGIFMLKSFPVEVDIVAKKVGRTDNKLTEVKRALLLYYERVGALPCPSDNTLAQNVAGFGAAVGNCAAGLTVIPNINPAIGNVIIGGVPIKDIGLPLSHAFDEWGNRLTYVMDSSYTNFKDGGDNILVLDSANAAVKAENGGEIPLFMGLVISHGKDGVGAFPRNGGATPPKACAGGATTQGENCDGGSDFMSDKWSTAPATLNDDIIEYLTPCPAAVNGCVAWFDATNVNGLGNVGLNNNDPISTWVDKSGSGNTAINSDAAPSKPQFEIAGMNAKASVGYAGNQSITTPELSEYGSAMTVFKRSNVNQDVVQIGADGDADNYLLENAYTNFSTECGALGATIPTVIDRDTMVFTSGAKSTDRVFSLGKTSNNLNGDIAEFVVYPTVLNDTNRQRLECAMARKWAVFPRDGLQLWLDGADSSTVSESASFVSEWRDKSGNLKHATQVTPALQPTYNSTGMNSKGVVSFDGTRSIATAITIPTSPTSDTFVVFSRGADTQEVASIGGNTLLEDAYTNYYNNGATVAITPPTTAAATPTIVYATGGTLADQAWTFGGANLTGVIAEVLVYNRALSAEERRITECYLAEKWNITIPIP